MGFVWIVKLVLFVGFEERVITLPSPRCRTGPWAIRTIRRPFIGGRYVLVDAHMSWNFDIFTIFDSRHFALLEASGRSRGQKSTKRTQTTDTGRWHAVIFHQSLAPLLRGHRSEESAGWTANDIALRVVYKLASYCCSVEKNRLQQKEAITYGCPRPRFSPTAPTSQGPHSHACQTSC